MQHEQDPRILGHHSRNTIITADFRRLGPWILACVVAWQILAMLG